MRRKRRRSTYLVPVVEPTRVKAPEGLGGSAAESARLGFPLSPASPAGRSGHGCA